MGAGNGIVGSIECGPEAAGKIPGAAKVAGTGIVDINATNPPSELDRVHSMLDLRAVVHLPAISFIDSVTYGRTTVSRHGAAIESGADIQRRNGVVTLQLSATMSELESSFINRGGVDDRSLSQLNILVRRDKVVAALRQGEVADAIVLRFVAIVVVVRDQSIAWVDGVFQTRTDVSVSARQQKSLAELSNIEGRIEDRSPDQLTVVGFVAIDFKKERGFVFDERPAQAAAVLSQLKG